MKNRLLPALMLIVMLVSLAGSASASQTDAIALLQVFIPDSHAVQRFASTGLPAYLSMDGFLLTGASASRQGLLDAAGLEYQLLDTDLSGAQYYLAYLRASQTAPAWDEYGQMLLAGDDYILLRSTPEAATRLGAAVRGMRAITLTPKPLPDLDAQADSFPDVVIPDPFVQQIIDQVTESEIYNLTAGLSGETLVSVGGAPYDINTRHTYSGEPIQKATQYVGEYLSDLELMVEYHTWEIGTPPNVIGKMSGLVTPRDIYIIGGHPDDMPDGTVAPGADDNASGSVATMLAARIFSQYYWGCTLRFAVWTGEEQGLLGSYEYAERSRLQKETILGYINLDMIAWNSDNRPGIDLYATDDIPATVELAQLFSDVVEAYQINLEADIFDNGMGASDHASFWDFNYVAILAIEDDSDFNDNYHTIYDTPDNLDMVYYTNFVKASLATFAHMSGCMLPTGALDGTVSDASSAAPIPGASLVFTDALGHNFNATAGDIGYYTFVLPTGTYTVTASAEGYLPATIAGVSIVADTLTTQNIELSLLPESYIIYMPMSLKNGE